VNNASHQGEGRLTDLLPDAGGRWMDAIDLVSERVRVLNFGRAMSEILWFNSIAERIQKSKRCQPMTEPRFHSRSLCCFSHSRASGNLRTFLDYLVSTNVWNLSVFNYGSISA